MKMKISTIEEFFSFGCGRCDKGGTPECKVHRWAKELETLRSIVLSCGLREELKWSQPCYSYNNTNVILVSAFKDHCVLSFFRGVLLSDSKNILVKPGENSNVSRVLRVSDVAEINALETTIKEYIHEAIELVKAGKKVEPVKTEQGLPDELQAKLDEDGALHEAFFRLTPGRQRSYLLHINAAKQEKTRQARVEKCISKILDGLGFNER